MSSRPYDNIFENAFSQGAAAGRSRSSDEAGRKDEYMKYLLGLVQAGTLNPDEANKAIYSLNQNGQFELPNERTVAGTGPSLYQGGPAPTTSQKIDYVAPVYTFDPNTGIYTEAPKGVSSAKQIISRASAIKPEPKIPPEKKRTPQEENDLKVAETFFKTLAEGAVPSGEFLASAMPSLKRLQIDTSKFEQKELPTPEQATDYLQKLKDFSAPIAKKVSSLLSGGAKSVNAAEAGKNDKFGYTIDQTITRGKKTYKYIGNDKWQEQ